VILVEHFCVSLLNICPSGHCSLFFRHCKREDTQVVLSGHFSHFLELELKNGVESEHFVQVKSISLQKGVAGGHYE